MAILSFNTSITRSFQFVIVFFLMLASSLGCGSSSVVPSAIDPALTACGPGEARILVGDGFFQTLCGCVQADEAPGKTFPSPGNLTCHLAKNPSLVLFYYLGTVLSHQIVSSGSNRFAPSPIRNPNDSNPIQVHEVSLSQSATTYEFVDIYSGMTGQIFVP